MRPKLLGVMLLLALFISSNQVYAWNYPRDGKFKQLHSDSDSWFYIDYERWDIKAPDKWQHFTGSYLSQKLLSRHLNKYLSASLIMGLGIVKEYEDAYREEWSPRDIFADFLGIVSGIYSNRKYRLLCFYDNDKVTLNLLLNIDF